MNPYPEHIKKELIRLADLLYERELNEALTNLDAYFSQWREEKISPFLLSKKIHEFHQGEARELYVRYVGSSMQDMLVARGIVLGKLGEKEISPEVMDVIQRIVLSMKSHQEEE